MTLGTDATREQLQAAIEITEFGNAVLSELGSEYEAVLSKRQKSVQNMKRLARELDRHPLFDRQPTKRQGELI